MEDDDGGAGPPERLACESGESNGPSIGIAVPVKNGARYIWSAISTLRASANQNLRVLVSVDHDEALLALLREAIPDPRFTFRSVRYPLSMAGHYEDLLNSLDTEWLTVLGQDDGIASNFDVESSRAISTAHTQGIEAISFRRGYFNWQDGASDRLGYVVKFASYGSARVVNSAVRIDLALCGLLSHFDLPQAYTNNLVRRNLLQRIQRNLNGRLIHEPIPDTFLGVAVACHTTHYLRWPSPAFWTGTSVASAGHRPRSTSWSEGRPEIPSYIALALTEGRDFGVGALAWERAQSSPLMVYSALQVVTALTGGHISRLRNVLGLGAVLSDSCLRFTVIGKTRLPKGLVSDLLMRCANPVDRFLVLASAPVLFILQISVRLARKIRFDYALLCRGFRISGGQNRIVRMHEISTRASHESK